MQTSRFQLGLVAALAVGLGFSLASPSAIGYPAGPAVSLGTNPVFSYGGFTDGAEIVDLITVPSDQVAVITDVVLMTYTNYGAYSCYLHVQLRDSSTTVGAFLISAGTNTYYSASEGNPASHSFASGMAVGPGDVMQLTTDGTCSQMSYAISGYYAQP